MKEKNFHDTKSPPSDRYEIDLLLCNETDSLDVAVAISASEISVIIFSFVRDHFSDLFQGVTSEDNFQP